VVVATGRLRRGDSTGNKVTITIPVSFHRITSSTDATTGWFIANKWYSLTYYAISPGCILNGAGGCNPCATCLTVNNLRPSYANKNDKQAILVLMGMSLNGSARPSTVLANYLENANPTGGTTLIYESRSGAPTSINDRVVVISP
jgi:hypothetical protein